MPNPTQIAKSITIFTVPPHLRKEPQQPEYSLVVGTPTPNSEDPWVAEIATEFQAYSLTREDLVELGSSILKALSEVR